MPARLQDFDILKDIGSGSYGKCKKVRRKLDGKILVWKELDYGEMSEPEKKLLVTEVNLLRELKHEHIVKYYDRILDKATTTLFIIMEFCEGGDLGTLIAKCKRDRKYLEEDFIWKVMQQLISALQECHRRDRGQAIVHRDLKPANIFLDSNHNVKLGDFGLARVLHHDTSFAKTFVGTPYYMSPEQMNHMSYNEKSDIWSLGCLLYEACSLSPPFTAANQQALAVKIREGRFKPIPSQYSDQLRSIISSMIRVTPLLRPSIEELVHHPKLQSVKKESDRTRRDSSTNEQKEELVRQEENLKIKERVLAEKEKELNNREKYLEVREKLANEKLASAEKLMKDLRLKENHRVLELRKETEQFEEVHPSILGGERLGKKVHFAVQQGKENDANFKEPALPVPKPNLQDRLYKARIRGAALRQAEATSKYKSKQLLSMR